MVACPHGDPIGVKPVSRESRERLARAAIEYALRGREEVLRAAMAAGRRSRVEDIAIAPDGAS